MAVGAAFKWSPSRYEAAPPPAPSREVNGEERAAAAAAAAWWLPWCGWRWPVWEDKTLLAWWTKRAVLQVWEVIEDHLLLFEIRSSCSLPGNTKNYSIQFGILKNILKRLFHKRLNSPILGTIEWNYLYKHNYHWSYIRPHRGFFTFTRSSTIYENRDGITEFLKSEFFEHSVMWLKIRNFKRINQFYSITLI